MCVCVYSAAYNVDVHIQNANNTSSSGGARVHDKELLCTPLYSE